MTFDQALVEIKRGQPFTRKGWNGKDMFVFLVQDDLPPEIEPFFIMFTAKQTFQFGWLASQTDLLANDWEAIDPSLATWRNMFRSLRTAWVQAVQNGLSYSHSVADN